MGRTQSPRWVQKSSAHLEVVLALWTVPREVLGRKWLNPSCWANGRWMDSSCFQRAGRAEGPKPGLWAVAGEAPCPLFSSGWGCPAGRSPLTGLHQEHLRRLAAHICGPALQLRPRRPWRPEQLAARHFLTDRPQLFSFDFEIEPCSAAQAGLTLQSPCLSLPRLWGHRHATMTGALMNMYSANPFTAPKLPPSLCPSAHPSP